MRVAVVDTYYLPFIATLYREEPALSEAGYEHQRKALMRWQMGTSDTYSYYLREQGHDAVDLVANCTQIQAAWAREYGGALPRSLGHPSGRIGRQLLLHSVLDAQLRSLNPDVVYVQDMRLLTRPELGLLRRQGRLVVGQIASAPPPARVVRGYDLVVTSFPHYVGRFRALGVDCVYLPLAFDVRIADRLAAEGVGPTPAANRPHPVAFVGGVTPEHSAGTALLERLAGRVPLAIWGYGVESLGSDSPLKACHRGEAWGMDMYRVLARSKVVVNRHIRAAEGNSNNMRMFEATGVGALLITERSPNLSELFEPGREVLAYGGAEELIELIEHYLADPVELGRVADAGQRRTLADHNYRRRIGELAELLDQRLPPKR
jgi:hypothetical protein